MSRTDEPLEVVSTQHKNIRSSRSAAHTHPGSHHHARTRTNSARRAARHARARTWTGSRAGPRRASARRQRDGCEPRLNSARLMEQWTSRHMRSGVWLHGRHRHYRLMRRRRRLLRELRTRRVCRRIGIVGHGAQMRQETVDLTAGSKRQTMKGEARQRWAPRRTRRQQLEREAGWWLAAMSTRLQKFPRA